LRKEGIKSELATVPKVTPRVSVEVFLERSVTYSPGCVTPAFDLYSSYRAHCDRLGIDPASQAIFGRVLQESGSVRRRKTGGKIVYNGVRISA